MVHNLSSKTLMEGQIAILQWDAGFNLVDAQPIDFASALESAIFRIDTDEETKNAIRQHLMELLVNSRQGYTLPRSEEMALQELRKDNSVVILPPIRTEPPWSWTE